MIVRIRAAVTSVSSVGVISICPFLGSLRVVSHVRDRFFLRQLRRIDASAQFGQFRFRDIHVKRTKPILVRCLLALWSERRNGCSRVEISQ